MPILLDNLVRDDYGVVLDLGCGVGYTTRQISYRLKDAYVIGVDYDIDQINIANKRKKPGRLEFLVGDGAKLDFKDSYFDCVFVFDAMHHIENYTGAIREIYRVLKNKGELYILDVDKKYINYIFRKIDRTQSFFSKQEFIDNLKKNEFKIQKEGRRGIFFYVICTKA